MITGVSEVTGLSVVELECKPLPAEGVMGHLNHERACAVSLSEQSKIQNHVSTTVSTAVASPTQRYAFLPVRLSEPSQVMTNTAAFLSFARFAQTMSIGQCPLSDSSSNFNSVRNLQ